MDQDPGCQINTDPHGSGSEILLMFFPFFCKSTGGALFCAKFLFFAEKTGAGDKNVVELD